MAEGPDLVIGKRLLDYLKLSGFRFERIAPGPDGPLVGIRDTDQWRDMIYLAGFRDSCSATRQRKSSLIVPGGSLVTKRASGDALNVMNTVLSDWPPDARPQPLRSLREPERERQRIPFERARGGAARASPPAVVSMGRGSHDG